MTEVTYKPGIEPKSRRIEALTGVAREVRESVGFWGKTIRVLIIGILIAYLALGGTTAVFALLAFMPWYAWAIVGVIIVLLLKR